MHSKSKLRWLNNILKERLHNNIQLNNSLDGSIAISIEGESSIIVVESNKKFYKSDTLSISSSEWNFDNGEWIGVLGSTLPSPGYSKIEYPLIKKTELGYIIKYDILGLIYWMLSRLEEVGCEDLDNHDRFASTSSHAFKYGYLERPIVDEWLLILMQVIQRLWPKIKLKQHNFKLIVSHDVDISSRYIFQSAYKLARGMVSDIFKYGDYMSAFRAPWMRIRAHKRLPNKDPLNTFDWIMNQSDRYNLISSFNFIAGKTHPQTDADYQIEHPVIRHLMKHIHQRGHMIGLHPSYNTFKKPDLIISEANRLRLICSQEGIKQDLWGGRMHVLRWKHPLTLNGWEGAKMNYDSTLGYADHVGFRCGTCFDYPAFDPISDTQLNIRIRPLIAMDVTVTAKRYMGLGFGKSAYDKFNEVKSACRAVNGSFTLLWHNDKLITKNARELYVSLLE